ncbi:MAG TPA: translation initiation factor IF-2 [Spirochaetota bacterium]|nr:translation initiation factor IF-2 [Spirochaetota bacterium]HRZ27347.1 translation initiation factor IF-2 [Spirochaetota bacterium]HSA14281.1 translation initiation factor IF-2 [Spirochaetota bacterium]
MKAIDIATKNHITMDDMMEVCRELGVACEGDAFDLSDKDIFLVEKKIEAIKKRKIQKLEQSKEGKKIKLKRKVHISKEIKEKTTGEPAGKPEEKEIPAEEKPQQAKPPVRREGPPPRREGGPSGDNKRPGQRPPFQPGQRRPGPGVQGSPGAQGRPFVRREGGAPVRKEGGVSGLPAKPEGAAPVAAGEAQKKRKKGGAKEKEQKGKYKKEVQEKEFAIKKRQHALFVKKEAVTPTEITITESVSVGELSKKLNVKANEVIAKLMTLGVMATINQVIDAETAQILAAEYNTEVKVVSLYEETVIKQSEEDRAEDYESRPPVVTVMGHVDHGKTKLLDAIRETDVTASEFGGITQHIGAYTVTVNSKKITFLDTPGHAAFTTMRARGAKVTDIVVLVVAANDGVMPQTIEAINHAKDAGVPIIVAINKIDLADANVQRVRQELTNYDLIPEQWGGHTLYAEISAKMKKNIGELLELILIQAEMLELKANNKIMAKGAVIESKLDPGRGPVSTILVQKGSLRVGDPFVVGVYSGKIRAMFDDHGKQLAVAGPSTPVEILGISGVPAAGDPFEAVESEKFAKQISQKRLDYLRIESAKKVRKVTLESLNEMIREGEVQEVRVIVKADVDGSAQALKESLEKLSTGEIRVKVIHSSTGGINESDVMLASASNALIIGFHVRPTGRVSEIAEKENVSIKFYNIIFEATDEIKAAMEGMLSPEIKEEITATGEIRQTFKVSKVGTIAGSVLLTGKIERSNKIRLVRDSVVIFDGKLKSLKRFKDDVSSVEAGQEFGFGLEDFNDIKDGDTFEAYKLVEIAKTLA